jgi:AcrR family transcriptional regulator
VAALLQMIDSGRAFSELNMRKLARAVGCAHTNIYNYFSTWEELQWFALAEALAGLMRRLPGGSAGENIDLIPGPGESGNLIEVYLGYGVEYPHRYRFTWLDPITGSAPPEVEVVLTGPGRVFLRWLENSLTKDAPSLVGNAYSIGGYLHAYMHGELAFRAAHRIRQAEPAGLEELVQRTERLYFALIEQLGSQT